MCWWRSVALRARRRRARCSAAGDVGELVNLPAGVLGVVGLVKAGLEGRPGSLFGVDPAGVPGIGPFRAVGIRAVLFWCPGIQARGRPVGASPGVCGDCSGLVGAMPAGVSSGTWSAAGAAVPIWQGFEGCGVAALGRPARVSSGTWSTYRAAASWAWSGGVVMESGAGVLKAARSSPAQQLRTRWQHVQRPGFAVYLGRTSFLSWPAARRLRA